MSKRTRRILLRAVVILGAVLPFVLGAISQWLLPLFFRHVASIESADRPSDDQEVWYGFGSKSVPVDRTGIRYWLDYQDSAGRIHVEMNDQPDNLVLLVSHPEVIEPELTRGRWLVLVYSLLSSDSVRAAHNSPDLARQLAGIARVAIRPTMHFDETKKWLPDYQREALKGHPFWVVFEDGIAIRRFEGWMENAEAVQFARQ